MSRILAPGGSSGAAWQEVGHVPPRLDSRPGKREQEAATAGENSALKSAPALNPALPLPKGEGRGEGKGAYNSLKIAAFIALLACSSRCLFAQPLVHAKDGSGIYGYKDTPKLPWCDYLVHDPDRPAPARVDPGPARAPAPAPSDAIVLFDGRNLSAWQSNDWKLVDGCIEAVGGSNLTTKERFGDFQLHLEWMVPEGFQGHPFDRGNSGVFLMGRYEIQIFDSWNEKIYPDGQAAAIYGQTPPLVNACRKPGEWQSFDILFTAPTFADGKLVQPARVTVLHNGVLVQNNEVIHGETGHRVLPAYQQLVSKAPLSLGGHKCPVRFRSIWLRPL